MGVYHFAPPYPPLRLRIGVLLQSGKRSEVLAIPILAAASSKYDGCARSLSVTCLIGLSVAAGGL